MSTSAETAAQCRILSLDGGGAKGFYTLGVLKEIEALTSRPLCESFDLIFGTSTGAIIASLLVLGYKVDAIHALYKDHVPSVMRRRTANGKSKALARLANEVFGDRRFSDVKTGIGIVATRWSFEKPIIFKADVRQSHGRPSTFVPGFGCTIAEAVMASCSAYPYFNKFIVKTDGDNEVQVIDGGYCANNPTLYAIADAVQALKKEYSDLVVVSVGVGVYPEPTNWVTPKYMVEWLAKHLVGFTGVQLLQKTLNINTNSMEQLRAILFRQVKTVRVNDTFEQPEMATDLMESDLKKLSTLYLRGRESFAKHEIEIRQMLGIP
jgi:predicted acylesterase/phospholipase RssA